MADAQGGQKLGGKATIPVGEMAKDMIDKIYPHLTKEQVEALNSGKPIPPSPDYVGLAALPAATASPDKAGRIQELNNKLEEAHALLREKVRWEGILDALVAASTGGPLVTGVLVFSDKNRMRRARKAVNQFVAQSYPHKQLVIVNASDMPVTTHPHRAIKEVKWEGAENPTTGAMRNAAIDLADGDVLFPFWDDDDVYDKHLLSYLVANYTGGKAVLLSSQIRVDIENSAVYMHVQDGIPNTILCPQSHARFLDQTGGEDVAFWNRHWGVKSTVVNNTAWPVNTMMMRVFDGHNALTREQFMIEHATPAHSGRWELGANEVEHMKAVLATFGLKAEAKIPTDEPVAALT